MHLAFSQAFICKGTFNDTTKQGHLLSLYEANLGGFKTLLGGEKVRAERGGKGQGMKETDWEPFFLNTDVHCTLYNFFYVISFLPPQSSVLLASSVPNCCTCQTFCKGEREN